MWFSVEFIIYLDFESNAEFNVSKISFLKKLSFFVTLLLNFNNANLKEFQFKDSNFTVVLSRQKYFCFNFIMKFD